MRRSNIAVCPTLFAVKYSYLIPLLPLLGAIVAGFSGAKCAQGQVALADLDRRGRRAILSIIAAGWHVGHCRHARSRASAQYPRTVYTWIAAGNFIAKAGFYFDPLTAVMLCVVTGIGFLITVFAAGYMKGEEGYFRFFAYLGLFIFSMTCLVMGNNLIMLYLGWEGVGLCSYLLIGYYYEKPSAREAAKKAFLVNRIGDFGFGLGIMLCFYAFGTVSYFGNGAGIAYRPAGTGRQIRPSSTRLPASRPAMDSLLLMLGAFGKSAQFPLYVWLPDAMEGPTPVCALIHAATMVTAGVYMIARCGTLFVAQPGGDDDHRRHRRASPRCSPPPSPCGSSI